jgi:hypothetical protein
LNTISAYLEKPKLSPILNNLLIKSSLPLAPVETVFAIDSTGLVGNRNSQQYSGGWAWVDRRWS